MWLSGSKLLAGLVFSYLGSVCCAYAAVYELYSRAESIIGNVDSIVVNKDVTLLDIARQYGLGYHDIKLLNPEVDTWMPDNGQIIQLPLKFILPNAPRKGIVLNIPEMRLYYFPPPKEGEPIKVVTYPLGIGRVGWNTPYRQTFITAKKKNPDWYPPASIRREYEEAGNPLPAIVKAGPDNPLGDYALRLGLPAYLIHGTNKPWGIGMRVTHGCIRLYPEDIEELFQLVDVGTAVNIINQPYKVGEADGIIHLEVHPSLQDSFVAEYDGFPVGQTDKMSGEKDNSFDQVVDLIVAKISERRGEYIIDWDFARSVFDESQGVPVEIGIYTPY